MIGRQRHRPGAWTGFEFEVRQRLVGLRAFHLIQLRQHLPARLGLLGLLPGQIAADEILGLVDQLLLLLVVGGHLLHPLGAQLEKALVVAGILDQLSVRQLDDLPDGAVEKGPVVGDEEIAPLERLQKLLEELDAGQVEMVGRLVEEQEIDVGQQDTRQHGPVLLTTAEGHDRPFPLTLHKADSGQHPLHLGVQRVAVGMFVVVLQVGVFLEQLLVLGRALRRVGQVMLDRPHLPLDRQHVGEGRLDIVEQRHPRLRVEMLPDMADSQPRGAQDLAMVGVFLLQQQPEERRLPRPVAADQPDFLAGVMLPCRPLHDVVRAVRFLDIVEAIEHCRADNAEGAVSLPDVDSGASLRAIIARPCTKNQYPARA